ncbi:hypothetical protein [Halorhabdus sp. SVX81]|nr:hypothetical protein [Halorhabdus sp. SVX81]
MHVDPVGAEVEVELADGGVEPLSVVAVRIELQLRPDEPVLG